MLRYQMVPLGVVNARFDEFDAEVARRVPHLIDELRAFVAVPSVSAQGIGLDDACAYVLERLRRVGVEAEAVPQQIGPPIVIGELGHGARTLLVYNHYDVQPPEPIDAWNHAPFDLLERDGMLFGRGVADNKGNLLARLHAIECYRSVIGELPLRLRFLYDGEEEVGSPSIGCFAEQHRDRLDADGCLWETGYKDAAGRPVISLGLKGLVYFELEAQGISADAHSSNGTILPQAAWRLVSALATLKTQDGEIALDGFAGAVVPPSAADRAMLDALPFDEDATKAALETASFARALTGGALKEAYFLGPSCTISGLTAGYAGTGAKTVLPARASAKLEFRLVPDLTPQLVEDLLRRHFQRRGFDDVGVRRIWSSIPVRSPADSTVAIASVEAAKATYGIEPLVYPMMPGSGPMYEICQRFGIPTTGFGVGNAASHSHGPNENIRVADYVDHIRCFARFLDAFGTSSPPVTRIPTSRRR